MSRNSSTKPRLANYTSQITWKPPVSHLIPLRGPSSQGSSLQAHLIFAILTKLRHLLFLLSCEGKRQGKEKYQTAIRKNQRRPEVKAGEKKQHGKYLLCMSTREVISTTLLQTRTLKQGGRNWRCAAMVTQTLSALGRKVRMKWLRYESALPHHSLCAIMVGKAGIAAPVSAYGFLKCL